MRAQNQQLYEIQCTMDELAMQSSRLHIPTNYSWSNTNIHPIIPNQSNNLHQTDIAPSTVQESNRLAPVHAPIIKKSKIKKWKR